MEKLISLLCRIFFVAAFIMLAIAVWDKILNVFGWKLTFSPYQPGRLFELSALLLVFVIVVLLRQIREQLKSK